MENTLLDDALSFANYQATLNQQRRRLKEKFDSDCIFVYNGGLFQITQTWLSSFDSNAKWIIDMNGQPVEIVDAKVLYETAKEAFDRAIAEYGEAFQNLRRQRSVRTLAGL
jgi:hypothetical protein